MHELHCLSQPKEPPSSRETTFSQRPEVTDDFVRNFLLKMGLSKTLDSFQTEW